MLVIVDFGVGNLSSIQNMFRKIGVRAVIASSPEQLLKAEKIVFPGMGAFDNCMSLYNRSEIKPVINEIVLKKKIPFLGICVGMQMLMQGSEEGQLPGLGWIKGMNKRFNSSLMPENQKIPNIGWHELRINKPSPLMIGLENSRFYFAHSYHLSDESQADILGTAEHGYEYTVAVEHENIIGVQFHPEKSHRFGLQLLKNFAENY